MRARIAVAVLLAGCFAGICGAEAPQEGGRIRRPDGTAIPVGEAEAFARKALAEAHVTGAQIAVLNGGKLAWSTGVWRAQARSGASHG